MEKLTMTLRILSRFSRRNIPAVLVVAMLSLAIIPGCTTPRKVVLDFTEAVVDQEFYQASYFCTQRYYLEELRYLEYAFTKIGEEERPPLEIDETDFLNLRAFLETEYDGDTARVWKRGSKEIVFILVKVNGRWKIDDTEIDWGPDWEEFKERIDAEGVLGF